MKESITVTKYDISIVRKFLFVRKTVTLKLDDLMSFGHDTEVSDYEELFDEGNIVLTRRSGPALRFGRGLPSWDVEEVAEKIEAITGRKFGQSKINLTKKKFWISYLYNLYQDMLNYLPVRAQSGTIAKLI